MKANQKRAGQGLNRRLAVGMPLIRPVCAVDLYCDVVLKATEWPTRDFSIKAPAKYLGFHGAIQTRQGRHRSWRHAAKSTRLLIGITIGRIRADRRAKSPITQPRSRFSSIRFQ
jgi:hypothetical protein